MDMVDYGCLELKHYGQKLPTKPQALRDSMNNFSITYDFIFFCSSTEVDIVNRVAHYKYSYESIHVIRIHQVVEYRTCMASSAQK